MDAVIHLVHHPDYVAPAPARSHYQWNKNGMVRDLGAARRRARLRLGTSPSRCRAARARGRARSRLCRGGVERRGPADKERRIGFPVTPRSRVGRRPCPAAPIWPRGWR